MKTFVIDLYAGPGAGKSTLAAETFACLKHRGESVELVREYVKDWAWRGEKVKRWDDSYLATKQLRRESALYGNVEVIVTDSPIRMTAIYEEVYRPNSTLLLNFTSELLRQQKEEDIYHIPCLVKRQKVYVSQGRYETAEQALAIDKLCQQFLSSFGLFHTVTDVASVLNALRSERGY